MAGIPSTGACEKCKERHVKCDAVRPSCMRCTGMGIICPGYAKRCVFVDEGPRIERRARRRKLNVSRDTSNSNSALRIDNEGVRLNGGNIKADSLVGFAHNNNGVLEPESNPIYDFSSGIEYQDPTNNSFRVSPDLDKDKYDISMSTANTELYRSSSKTSASNRHFHRISILPSSPSLDYPSNEPSPPVNTARGSEVSGEAASIEGLTMPVDFLEQSSFFSEFAIESDHEMAFLLNHYTEVISPWLDLFDSNNYFGRLVPFKVRKSPLLKYATAAIAAKQLGCVQGRKATTINLSGRYSITELYPDAEHVDWDYKAANYYHKAVSYLRINLGDKQTRGSLPQPPSDKHPQHVDGHHTTGLGMQQDLFSQVGINSKGSSRGWDKFLDGASILSLYEFLNGTGEELTLHLIGVKSLLDRLANSIPAAEEELSGAARAAFWTIACEDYINAFIYRTYTFLDTEDVSQWHFFGANPDTAKSEQDFSYVMIWLICRVVNYVTCRSQAKASGTNENSTGPPVTSVDGIGEAREQATKRDKLCEELDSWFKSIPETFTPCARLEKSPSFRTITESSVSTFPEIYFTLPECAASVQFYHFAKILLLLDELQDDPQSQPSTSTRLRHYRETSRKINHHCLEICGIAMGRPPSSVRVHMILPLFLVGQCLEDPEERKFVVDLLREIEMEVGMRTEHRVKQLLAEWE